MNTAKKVITQTHPGLELPELIQQLEESLPPIILNIGQQQNHELIDLKNKNSNDIISQLGNILIKFVPKNFEEFLALFKTTSIVFITSKFINDDYNLSINILRRTFQMNGKNWDRNPIHLHLISKEIFNCLKDDRNRLYFARKINNISRISLYISICIVWAIFFNSLQINVIMYRFHKFSEIIDNIKNIDLDQMKNNENQLYILLESISFLLNIITSPKILTEQINKRFRLYFEYKNDDLIELKSWCLRLNRMFFIKVSDDAEFNFNYALISDILELDILHFLENIYTSDINDEATENLLK